MNTAGILESLATQHESIAALLFEVASKDPEERRRALDKLTDELIEHLAAEQEQLYPSCGSCFSRAVIDEVLAEHAEIKRVLADLVWVDLDDPCFEDRLALLTSLLDGHIVWQEEHMFEVVASDRRESIAA